MMWIENIYQNDLVNTDKLMNITVEKMGVDEYSVVGYDCSRNAVTLGTYRSEDRARAVITYIKDAIKNGHETMVMPGSGELDRYIRR